MSGLRGLDWQGLKVVDPSGDKVGTVAQVLVDGSTGSPEWAKVSAGLFGGSSYVPLVHARLDGDVIRVPLYRDRIRGAPAVETSGELSHSDEARLYRWYGYDELADRWPHGPSADAEHPGSQASGEGEAAVTRSEERLDVSTVAEPVEHVRLRKRVVTEHVTHTIALRREELVIEREVVDDPDEALARDPDPDARISETEYVVTLYREVPVVSTRVVPVERVHLRKTLRTEEVEVGGETRRERVEVEREAAASDGASGAGAIGSEPEGSPGRGAGTEPS